MKIKRLFIISTALPLLLAALYAALLFLPKDAGAPYRLTVGKGQGISAVSRKLADEGKVYSRWVLVSAAYLAGTHDKLVGGSYRFPARFSTWDIVARLRRHNPDTVRVQIIEGTTFAQMRRTVAETEHIRHDSAKLSDQELLDSIAPGADFTHPEGLFFPDSYEIDAGSSDIQIFQAAFKAMQKELADAWDGRQDTLPYQTPYELLIMASIIEKETAHEDDRADVSAVFRNRLNQNMRLQTDPTVIYGMGKSYTGRIRKADLQRDTPYNTYTRHGLPPSPIALPGRAALRAAADPSDADYLFFVSRMDGTGKSQFSRTLDEHNAAVRRYILKK